MSDRVDKIEALEAELAEEKKASARWERRCKTEHGNLACSLEKGRLLLECMKAKLSEEKKAREKAQDNLTYYKDAYDQGSLRWEDLEQKLSAMTGKAEEIEKDIASHMDVIRSEGARADLAEKKAAAMTMRYERLSREIEQRINRATLNDLSGWTEGCYRKALTFCGKSDEEILRRDDADR